MKINAVSSAVISTPVFLCTPSTSYHKNGVTLYAHAIAAARTTTTDQHKLPPTPKLNENAVAAVAGCITALCPTTSYI
ncbi:hypothetical protein GQX74_006413 [Glossina fuscipes]|nr:hypothetical protein GQX74_006413 [Glossina fuscipes]